MVMTNNGDDNADDDGSGCYGGMWRWELRCL